MSDNNLQKDGQPVIIVYECNSGVVFWVTPINLPTLRAIQLKARSLFPDVDKTPYQQPQENAFSEGQLTPAEDNPDYLKAVAELDAERSRWIKLAVFKYAAKMPKFPTEQDLIQAYQFQLAKLREIADLPADDYEAIMFHIVLSWNQVGEDSDGKLTHTDNDFNRIYQLCIQTVALEPSEVTAGIRFFRAKISGR